MPPTTTFQQLQAVIVDTLGIDESEVQLTSHYTNDLRCDSLDLAELQLQTEKAFGVDIPDAIAEQQLTVQDTVNYLNAVTR